MMSVSPSGRAGVQPLGCLISAVSRLKPELQLKRKAWDLNPHDATSRGLANRPGEPYPATFRRTAFPGRRCRPGKADLQWTHRELNPDFQSAEPVSSHWTM